MVKENEMTLPQTMADLMVAYEECVEREKNAMIIADAAKTARDMIEQKILDELVNSGHQLVKSAETGRSFFKRIERFYSVPAEQKEQFILLLDQVDADGQPVYPQFAGMLERNYNAQRLRSRCKEIIDNDGDLPDAFKAVVKVSEVPKLGVRK